MKTYRAPPRSQGSTAVDKRKVQLSEQTVKTTKTQQAYRYRCRGELEDGEEDDEGPMALHPEEDGRGGCGRRRAGPLGKGRGKTVKTNITWFSYQYPFFAQRRILRAGGAAGATS